MRGKNIFTEEEAKDIRVLIKEKLKASDLDQKKIRNKIRRRGFYYQDFYSVQIEGGYTVFEFDDLINQGRIKITKDGSSI